MKRRIEAGPADATPAEPEFDEIWSPGGRRPDTPRQQNRRPVRADGAAADAPAEGGRPPRRFNRDAAAAPKPEGDKPEGAPARPRYDATKPRRNFGDDKKPAGGKPGYAGKRNDKPRDDWKEHRPREERKVSVDPDSPWAALLALRNPKSE